MAYSTDMVPIVAGSCVMVASIILSIIAWDPSGEPLNPQAVTCSALLAACIALLWQSHHNSYLPVNIFAKSLRSKATAFAAYLAGTHCELCCGQTNQICNNNNTYTYGRKDVYITVILFSLTPDNLLEMLSDSATCSII